MNKVIKITTSIKIISLVVLLTVLSVLFWKLKPTPTPISILQIDSSSIGPLGIRQGSNGSVFYDNASNQNIYLRGNNYLRFPPTGLINNFEVGAYDKERHRIALQEMKSHGYNSIRVTFIYAQMANKTETGLSSGYIANVTDFLNMAKAQGVYVFGLIAHIPQTGGYWPTTLDSNFEGPWNQKQYLEPSFLPAKKRYVKDVMTALKDAGAPLEIVLWGIENEPHFEKNKKPFNLTSGLITTANGKTYNMAIPDDKLRMMDENLSNYMNEVRKSIREVIPNALVGISIMSPAFMESELSNVNWILKTDKLFTSEADFIDIHYYPGTGDFATVMNAFGVTNYKGPLLLGEFGAYPMYYPTLQVGANALRDIQITTCKNYNFQGWYTYDWDTTEIASWFRIYQAVEGGGVIAKMLSPNYRADPCSPDPAIKGRVESVSPQGVVKGWIYDQDTPDNTRVNFYLDHAVPPQGILIGSITPTIDRPEIQKENIWMKTTKVGFEFQVPTTTLTDGKNHTIFAQAVNTVADGTYTSYLLPSSGLTLPMLTTQPLTKPGDLNSDGSVNILDFSLLISKFGNPYTIYDFTQIVANFGK